MSDQIKQIAERLRGLRDVLELTSQEVAESCQLTVEEYLGMESGEKDIGQRFAEDCPQIWYRTGCADVWRRA